MKVICLYNNPQPEKKYTAVLDELKIELVLHQVNEDWYMNKDFIQLVFQNNYFLVFTADPNSDWLKYIAGGRLISCK